MSQLFRNKKFSSYLGEQRAILDIIIGFTPNPSQTPTPSPTATLQITPSPTGTNTPTPSITVSATATLTPTPTNTATNTPTTTNTATPTPTRTGTPTPTMTMTPTSSPAVPYQSAVLEVECNGGILLGGDSITVDGAPYPLTTSGGTIGVAGCVNVLIRNGTAIIYRMVYGPNSSVCLTPPIYDEVRLVNFNYNPAIGLRGGYDYTEQLYMSGVLVGGSVKQTAIVNPPQDLGNGCPTQDLDLVVTFFVESIAPTPSVTPTNTLTPTTTNTPTNTETPTNTPTPTNTETPTNTPTPTETETPTPTPTNTETPTTTPTPTNTGTPTLTPTPTTSPSAPLDPDAVAYLNVVVSTGGTINATISAATNTLFVDLKTSGLYSKIDAMYPFIGGTANSSKFNAINPLDTNAAYRLTFNGTPVFSNTFGYGNSAGGTDAGDSHYVTSINTPQDQHISVYMGTNNTSSTPIMGWYDGANEMAIYPNFLGGGLFYPVIRAAGQPYQNYSQPTQPGIGYFIATTDGTNVIGSKNGGIVVNGPQVPATNALLSIYIGNCNGNGGNGVGEYRFATIGKALTTGEMTTLSNIVNAFQTALGRNTY
jgi:hypothetical protein